MGTPALIALGSNLGDRRAHLDAAVTALSETPGVGVVAVSPYHGTDPVGGPRGQGEFLNAAALLDCSIDPFALHARLQAIESARGRTRSTRWGERSLDLDLLLFGNQILDIPALTVPHLRMAVRRFVLAPAAEVAPEMVDPLTRRTIADLLANLDRRPSVLRLSESFRPFERLDPTLRDRISGAINPGPATDPAPGRWLLVDDRSAPPVPATFEAVVGDQADAPRAPTGGGHGPPRLRVRGTRLPGPGPDGTRRLDRLVEAIVAEIAAACAASRAG
jgi:2-amino-4-hydroxy-6-hydroxymethyldihydropteridine diphosphokinase